MQKKASRNKTIDLSPNEINAYARRSLKLGFKASLDYVLDSTIHQDTLKTLDYLPDNSVDLIIADPPYNLTKVFGNSVFKERDFNDYKKWLDGWLKKLPRILKETGSVYICSDWRTSITIPEIAGKYFILQNRISWEREKGRGAKDNWKNCLEECYESLDAYAGCVCQNGLFLVVPLVAGVIMWRRKIRFYKLVLALPLVYLAGNVLYWRFWGNL